MQCGDCSSELTLEDLRHNYDIAVGDHHKLDAHCDYCEERVGSVIIHDDGIAVKGNVDHDIDIDIGDLELRDIPTDHVDFDIPGETDDVIRIIFDPAAVKRCTLTTTP